MFGWHVMVVMGIDRYRHHNHHLLHGRLHRVR